jgi:myo-inositol-1(or 4)-monophosphatase
MLIKNDLDYLKKNICNIVRTFYAAPKVSDEKEDGSIVTSADVQISELVCKLIKGSNILSEEEEGSLSFPTYILDPIDGTREFYKGSSECATSLAYMVSSNISHEDNWGWIFAPLSGFEVDSRDLYVEEQCEEGELELLGMVSRGDTNKGIFNEKNFIVDGVRLVARGSIAFKLGLLTISACDFVFSATPKKIWDIAAGTVLLHKKGYKLYNGQGEVEELDSEYIEGPLLWCLETNYLQLKYLLEVKI